MTEVDVKNFETKLEAWRKIDPVMNHTVLFAGTNHDESGIAFTRDGPSIVASKRMIALARSATKLVEEKSIDLDMETLFNSTTSEYDFVISFKKSFLAPKNAEQEVSSTQKFKNLAVQEAVDTEMIGFNPVQLYIEDLRDLYGDSVVLFHGDCGGFVAGLWNPLLGGERKFKVNAGCATKPCLRGEDGDEDEGEEGKVVLDREVILAEMVRLGGDMIKSVKVKGS